LLRRDVLAVGKLEEILFSIGNEDVVSVVFIANVAGCKPAIIYYRLSRFRVAVITAHDVWPAHQDLAIFRDRDVDAGECFADRADAIIFRPVGANDAGFGHAIALQDVDPGAEE